MRNLLILAYHRVLPESTQVLAVSQIMLERQVKFLKLLGYRFMTLQNAVKAKGRIAVISFDDGYKDNLTYALPILNKLNVPAVVFVTTGYLDKQQPYYWDLKNTNNFNPDDCSLISKDLLTLQQSGWEIGSHTVNHFELDKLSAQELTKELEDSKNIIEKITGKPCVSICYPRGSANLEVLAMAKKYYQNGVVTYSRSSDPLARSRVGLYGHDSFLRFIVKLLLRHFR